MLLYHTGVYVSIPFVKYVYELYFLQGLQIFHFSFIPKLLEDMDLRGRKR